MQQTVRGSFKAVYSSAIKNYKTTKSSLNSAKNSAKTIKNSIKTAFSVIGAVIGAGFITGREILSFFGDLPPVLAGIAAFAAFFGLFYFLLRRKEDELFKIGNAAVYIISVLIMASMLGATDSLFALCFGVPQKTSIGSIFMLILSTALCFCGMKGIEKANLFLVPFMIVCVLVCAIYSRCTFNSSSFFSVNGQIFGETLFFGESLDNAYLSEIGAVSLFKSEIFTFSENDGGLSSILKLAGCAAYAAMNALLSQPFFSKIKSEKNEYSPLLVAAVSAGVLGGMIFVYLFSLSGKNAENIDIPAFLLCGSSTFLKYLLCGAVFCAILTTQISTEYPLVKLAERKKRSGLYIIVLALFTFIISRLGFYAIVDKIYPAIAVFAALYYLILICASLVFRLKPRLRTSVPQARSKSTSKS